MSSDPLRPPSTAITADVLFSDGELPHDAVLAGDELVRVYWRVRGRERERIRQEAFWASTNEALSSAYAQLERKREELDAARAELVRLNAELEERVEAQVQEIVARARTVDDALQAYHDHEPRFYETHVVRTETDMTFVWRPDVAYGNKDLLAAGPPRSPLEVPVKRLDLVPRQLEQVVHLVAPRHAL